MKSLATIIRHNFPVYLISMISLNLSCFRYGVAYCYNYITFWMWEGIQQRRTLVQAIVFKCFGNIADNPRYIFFEHISVCILIGISIQDLQFSCVLNLYLPNLLCLGCIMGFTQKVYTVIYMCESQLLTLFIHVCTHSSARFYRTV